MNRRKTPQPFAARRNAAFTLIEIMIVVLIIGILLAIAVPNFVRTREATRQKSCASNLRKIEWAKDQWAMDNRKGPTDEPTTTELAGSFKYLSHLPECPGGGDYTIGTVNDAPTCDYSGTYTHTAY